MMERPRIDGRPEAGKSGTAEQELWDRYISTQDQEVRELLIGRYMSLARRIAARMYSVRPAQEIEFDDYLQYAMVGLMEAVDRYDPVQGAAFATFATYRIRGAIFNGLENTSERLAQGAYRKRIRQERVESLRGKAGHEDDLFSELTDVAIGLALGYMLEDSSMKTEVADEEQNPYRSYELNRIRENLELAVAALPDRERELIRLHYTEFTSFTSIAESLGVTKGRVAQIHKRALTLLRKAYTELQGLDIGI